MAWFVVRSVSVQIKSVQLFYDMKGENMSSQVPLSQVELEATKAKIQAAVAAGKLDSTQGAALLARVNAAQQQAQAPASAMPQQVGGGATYIIMPGAQVPGMATPAATASGGAPAGGAPAGKAKDKGEKEEKKGWSFPQLHLDGWHTWLIAILIIWALFKPTAVIQTIRGFSTNWKSPDSLKVLVVDEKERSVKLNLPFLSVGLDWSIFGNAPKNKIMVAGEDLVTVGKPGFSAEFGSRYGWRFILWVLFGIGLQFALDATQNLTGPSVGGLIGPGLVYLSCLFMPPFRNLMAVYGFFLMNRLKEGQDESKTRWVTFAVVLFLIGLANIVTFVISIIGQGLYAWVEWLVKADWLPYLMWCVAAWYSMRPINDATSLGAFTVMGLGGSMMFLGKFLWIPEIQGTVFGSSTPFFRGAFLVILCLGGGFFIKDVMTRGQRRDENMTINGMTLIRLWPMVKLLTQTLALALVVKFVINIGVEWMFASRQGLDGPNFQRMQEWMSIPLLFIWIPLLELFVSRTYNAFKIKAAQYALAERMGQMSDALANQARLERLNLEAELGDVFVLGGIVLPNDLIAFVSFMVLFFSFVVPALRWWIL